MKAATAILGDAAYNHENAEELAEIIDRETGLPGLLGALHLCAARLDEYEDAKDGIALESARLAIAKAEGKA